jgi:hypothetical protein
MGHWRKRKTNTMPFRRGEKSNEIRVGRNNLGAPALFASYGGKVYGVPLILDGITPKFNLGEQDNLTVANLEVGDVNVIGDLNITKVLRFNSTEDLAHEAASSLNKTISYFTTGGSGETATLAASIREGQIKVFYMVLDGGGDMVITVTNAAWGGSGTLTFADTKDCVVLVYFNSKWNIISNVGSVATA